MQPAEETRFTEDEYLALENASATKHEFAEGRIISMAGGTTRHNLIAMNVGGALRNALAGRGCLVLSSDQRIHIAATGRYTYPDLTVVCGRAQHSSKDPLSLENPLLVVEVLSPSTAAYDLGEKFGDYRRIPSLQHFVAVRADLRRVECWRRTDVGRWEVTESEGTGIVELAHLGIAVQLDAIYENIELAGS